MRIDGRATTALSENELTALRRKRVGFVFQFFQLLPTLTVLENVELPLLLAGAANTAEAARERLRWVGLEEKAASMPYQLSGGQMQRVAIARALVHSPDLLMADEPTGNLDTASGDQVLALLREAATRFGATVLMATHSAEAAAIADVRVRLRDGRIQGIDGATDRHETAAHPDPAPAAPRPAAHRAHHPLGGAGRRGGGGHRPGRRAATGCFRSSMQTLAGKTDLEIVANGGIDESWMARLAALPFDAHLRR